MSASAPSRLVAHPPLRGTQSLVSVMAFVWKHPSLTLLELLWRWLAAVPLLWLLWHAVAGPLSRLHLDTTALGTLTFFEPVGSVSTLSHALRPYLPVLARVARWWVPLMLLVWALASASGRAVLLRRADPRLRPRWLQMFTFRLARALLFLGLLVLWARFLAKALRATVLDPNQHGAEPSLVLFTAAAVALTLAAFMVWSLGVWLVDLAPLKTMADRELQPALNGQLRSKLVETNLVMGIVRVALFVLAMTFSASPLPFQTQQTQAYIDVWWVGVALFYLLSSDFFHVVRTVTYLRLLQTLTVPSNAAVPPAS